MRSALLAEFTKAGANGWGFECWHRDERMSGGLAREVSVVALGVERGRGSAEEAMVTQMAKDQR